MGWLAEGGVTLNIAAADERLTVLSLPMKLDFPVSFAAEEERETEEDEAGQITLSENFDTSFDTDETLEEAEV